jgi:hypothetical protein
LSHLETVRETVRETILDDIEMDEDLYIDPNIREIASYATIPVNRDMMYVMQQYTQSIIRDENMWESAIALMQRSDCKDLVNEALPSDTASILLLAKFHNLREIWSSILTKTYHHTLHTYPNRIIPWNENEHIHVVDTVPNVIEWLAQSLYYS